MTQAKYTWGRWSAGVRRFGTGAREVILAAIVDDNEDETELRAVGRWKPSRGMVPDLGMLMDRAIRMPLEGRPHLPQIVRVSDAGVGEDLQGVRPETRVEVGPVPFLESELERLAKDLDNTERWRWVEGDVTPAMVKSLFDVARAFVEHPWDLHDPDQVVRVSFAGREAHCAAMVATEVSATGQDVITVAIAPTPEALGDWKDDVLPEDGIDVWFYERDDLPDEAWDEVVAHGWQAGEVDLYPRVLVGGEVQRAPTAAELRLAIDMLDAMAAFHRDGHAVPEEFGGRASATLVLESGVTATVSVDPDELIARFEHEVDPDEELDDDELEQLEREQEEDEAFLELDDDAPWAKAPPPTSATVRAAPKPGRNEACWCGSGKKYKKCHLDEDEAKARA